MTAQYDGDSASGAAIRLLNLLLDRYESSKAFSAGEQTARRVQVSLTDALVPGYVSGGMEPDDRRHLHATLQTWEQTGIVSLDWVRFEVGNLLRRVYLEWGGLERAYSLLGRVPKQDELTSVQAELVVLRTQLSHAWMQKWLVDVLGAIEERKSLPATLLPADAERRTWLLQSLRGLVDKGDEELPMRLFSKRYLKSSKIFEQHVRSRLSNLLRRYWSGDAEHAAQVAGMDGVDEAGGAPGAASGAHRIAGDALWLEDEQLLAEVGIEVTHEDISFCGPLRFHIDGNEEVDLSRFPSGLALDTEVLRNLQVTGMPVRRILSIENKANYRHYVRNERRPDELVVYSGGFHSPGKRQFLRKLRAYGMQSAADRTLEFVHWGDLDYGGILILQSLRETTWPEVQPWRMEPEWLDTYVSFLESFSSDYANRLAALLQDERYQDYRPLIEKILRVGGTLEQEAFLV